jgi:large subunit ribosomal protein L4
MELKVVNLKNESVGKQEVDAAIFKAEYKPHLLHDYVVMQRRALRQGTHSTLTRAEVTGTGKKPFKQKGTGHARQGTLIGPHQPGGGIAFGPKPRDYTSKLNRSTRLEALRGAFSQKNFEGKLFVIDTFDIKSGKTKDASKVFNKFSERSVLVIGNFSPETFRSVRNIPNCKALATEGLNVFDILHHDHVLITKDALAKVTDRLQGTKKVAAKTTAKVSKKKVAA